MKENNEGIFDQLTLTKTTLWFDILMEGKQAFRSIMIACGLTRKEIAN